MGIGGDLYEVYDLGLDKVVNNDTVQDDTDEILPLTSETSVELTDPQCKLLRNSVK